MTDSEPTRLRRPPPDFRHARVVATRERTPRLVSVTLEGPDLVGFEVDEPAASVRLLLPRRGPGTVLEPVAWNGNEFLYDDGTRPPIRTLTPLRVDTAAGRLDVEVVVHGHGALSRWAAAAPVGDEVAVSGPGAGYVVPADASRFLVVGDESALPAIGQVLEALPESAEVQVVVEIADRSARVALPERDGVTVRWVEIDSGDAPGSAMTGAVAAMPIADDLVVWAAGEAAAVQALRRVLLQEAGLPRGRTVIRGYWKHGRDGAGTS